MSKLTWEKLVELNPELGRIEADIKALAAADTGEGFFCANRHWYNYKHDGGFRRRLILNVGWHCYDDPDYKSPPPRDGLSYSVSELMDHPAPRKLKPVPLELGSQYAYQIAYDHLYNLLPDCRHPGCTCC